jgi:hypothetical protein
LLLHLTRGIKTIEKVKMRNAKCRKSWQIETQVAFFNVHGEKKNAKRAGKDFSA